ncbi:MAG TPA: hypothetical protein V6C72_06815, partial [Chroococcales cyanobacterium]
MAELKLFQRQPKLAVSVANPCAKRWDEMEGTDCKRFCNVCQMNVHNLSAMSEFQARQLVANRDQRLCVFMYKSADGTVVVDSCPAIFRPARKSFQRLAALSLLLVLTIAIALGYDPLQQVEALNPSLWPAPWNDLLMPRNLIHSLTNDIGYRQIVAIRRMLVAIAVFLSFSRPMPETNSGGQGRMARVIELLLARSFVPLL